MSYEVGEPEVEIIERDELSSQYPSGFSIWCYIRPPIPRRVDHVQAPNNEPVDISLSNVRPLSQTTSQEVFATEWQNTTQAIETWNRDVAQLARPEPVAAGTVRSYRVSSSRTRLPDSPPVLVELGDLENRLPHARGEYGSRQTSLSSRSQSEVHSIRRQIRRIRRALEGNSRLAEGQARFPLALKRLENDDDERLQIRYQGRARPFTSPAPPPILQSNMDHRQRLNDDRRHEPSQRVSTPHPHYTNLPPPAYSFGAPEYEGITYY